MISTNSISAAYGVLSGAPKAPSLPQQIAPTDFASLLDTAETSAAEFATGNADMHNVVVALTEAELALQTAVNVRDRLVGAYQELLRMPL